MKRPAERTIDSEIEEFVKLNFKGPGIGCNTCKLDFELKTAVESHIRKGTSIRILERFLKTKGLTGVGKSSLQNHKTHMSAA